MKYHGKISEAGDLLLTPMQKQFLQKHAGKNAFLMIDDAPTGELRRFFEGCIVPVYFYSHPHSGWIDFADAREHLKINFLPSKQLKHLKHGMVVVPMSTNDLTKAQFSRFVNSVIDWMTEQGTPAECIDPDGYKYWRDTDLVKGGVYPPLLKLRDAYLLHKNSAKPWDNPRYNEKRKENGTAEG